MHSVLSNNGHGYEAILTTKENKFLIKFTLYFTNSRNLLILSNDYSEMINQSVVCISFIKLLIFSTNLTFYWTVIPSLSILTVPWLPGILKNSLYNMLKVSEICINFCVSILQTKRALFTSQDTFTVMANRSTPVISMLSVIDSSQYSSGAFNGNISPNIMNNGQ